MSTLNVQSVQPRRFTDDGAAFVNDAQPIELRVEGSRDVLSTALGRVPLSNSLRPSTFEGGTCQRIDDEKLYEITFDSVTRVQDFLSCAKEEGIEITGMGKQAIVSSARSIADQTKERPL